MRIGWKTKALAFRLLRPLPSRALYVLQKYVSGHSRVDITAINRNWLLHRRALQTLEAKRVIEFGAGKNLAQNIYLSKLGIAQILVDLNPMLDLSLVRDALVAVSRLDPAISVVTIDSAADLEAKFGIAYRAPFDMGKTDYPAGSFDAVISTNTLEHIPPADIRRIYVESKRILRPGGQMLSKIDYGDHYGHTDKSISILNFLTYSEAEWAYYNPPNHYQNRLRHEHHIRMLEAAGFRIVQSRPMHVTKDIPRGIRPELLTGEASDFATGGYIVAEA